MKKTLICVSLLASCAAMAQTTSPVAQSVQRAIEGNPEVAARFNAFRASNDEIDVASGAWKPHLDASADAGRRAYDNSQLRPQDQHFYAGGVRLELSQLLWDGLATHHEVERLSHTKLLRYFEFLDATEQFGMEAARAYYDVVRYRKLVQLAEDNYVQHKVSFEQVQSRVNAGVGRGVDLEQVVARFALAESTLVAERANLHDVVERYVRLVGSVPPADNVSAVSMLRPLPASEQDAMRAAALQSPVVAGAIENLRDKACNDTRETIAVAFNDVKRLNEQLGYLDRNVVAIQKARDAYRQQFDIGQRSLLDLLNSESELYTARRSYAMAEEDLATAIVRTYAGMGTLVASLGLKRPEAQELAPEAQNWGIEGDASSRCPLTTVAAGGASFSQLDARAEQIAAARAPLARPAVAIAPAVGATPGAAAAPGAAQSTTIALQRLHDWAAAWMSHDVDLYMAFYAPDFKPALGSKARWAAARRRLVAKKGPIAVALEHVQARALTDTRVETGFDQVTTSGDFKDSMHETLVWDRVGAEWKIVGESKR